MTAKRSAAVAAVLMGCLPGAVLAQQKPQTVAKEVCSAPLPPPPEFKGWADATPLTAARRSADLPKAVLVPGKAITAQLHPVEAVEYRAPPAKADGPPVYGGLYRLKITQSGTYRLAADAGPWMDIFADGSATPVASTAHGHGPACTGVGKEVDFPLKPGDYLVQFSESLTPTARIMLARLPD